jgi:hypothetical protein
MFFFPTEKHLVTFDKRPNFESCADILTFVLIIQMLMVYKRLKDSLCLGPLGTVTPLSILIILTCILLF